MVELAMRFVLAEVRFFSILLLLHPSCTLLAGTPGLDFCYWHEITRLLRLGRGLPVQMRSRLSRIDAGLA